jgi:hypothetical protein
MKTLWKTELSPHAFLTLALDGDEKSSRPSNPTAGLHADVKIKSHATCMN